MPYVSLGDVQLFYSDEGSGPTVLLVHGFACDSNDWCHQIPALVEQYRVIAVDLRGFGASSAPASGYTVPGFAADLAALIAHLGAGPVVAAGHSMGGAVVVALAVEHPALVRAIVPVDAAYGMSEATAPHLERILARMRGPDVYAATKDLFGRGFYPPASPPYLRAWHHRRIETVRAHVLPAAFSGLFAKESFAFRPASEAYLRRVAVPALSFRAGDQNPAAVAAWERQQFTHPLSKAVAWEGSGHFLHEERPAEFNAILLRWLRHLPPLP
jgi:pimeloyl-ACP methyl ester carboxylesterase